MSHARAVPACSPPRRARPPLPPLLLALAVAAVRAPQVAAQTVSPTPSPYTGPCTPTTCDFQLLDADYGVALRLNSLAGPDVNLIFNDTGPSSASALSFRLYPYRCPMDTDASKPTGLLVHTQTGRYYRSVITDLSSTVYSGWTVEAADVSTACASGGPGTATVHTWRFAPSALGGLNLLGRDELSERGWGWGIISGLRYYCSFNASQYARTISRFRLAYVTPSGSPRPAPPIPTSTPTPTSSAAPTAWAGTTPYSFPAPEGGGQCLVVGLLQSGGRTYLPLPWSARVSVAAGSSALSLWDAGVPNVAVSGTGSSWVATAFTAVRLDPASLTVTTNDFNFSSSQGGLAGWSPGDTARVFFANAVSCDVESYASVDLRGTPFAVASAFVPYGWVPTCTQARVGGDAANQTVKLRGVGGCGGCRPDGAAPGAQVVRDSIDTIALTITAASAARWPRVACSSSASPSPVVGTPSPTASVSATPVGGCTPYTCDFQLTDLNTGVVLRNDSMTLNDGLTGLPTRFSVLTVNVSAPGTAPASFRLVNYSCPGDPPGTALLLRTQTWSYFRSTAGASLSPTSGALMFENAVSSVCSTQLSNSTVFTTWRLVPATGGAFTLVGRNDRGADRAVCRAVNYFVYSYNTTAVRPCLFTLAYVPAAPPPLVPLAIPSVSASSSATPAGTPSSSVTLSSTASATATPSLTGSGTSSVAPSATSTGSPGATATGTPSLTPPRTGSPTATGTASATPAPPTPPGSPTATPTQSTTPSSSSTSAPTPLTGCTPYTCDFELCDADDSDWCVASGRAQVTTTLDPTAALAFRLYRHRCSWDDEGSNVLMRVDTGGILMSSGSLPRSAREGFALTEAPPSSLCGTLPGETTVTTWRFLPNSYGGFSVRGADAFGRERFWSYLDSAAVDISVWNTTTQQVARFVFEYVWGGGQSGSSTATLTRTPSATSSPSPTPTATPTATSSPTGLGTASVTPSGTPTSSITASPPPTASVTPSATSTPSSTPPPTRTSSATASLTPSRTPSGTATPPSTPTASGTSSRTPAPRWPAGRPVLDVAAATNMSVVRVTLLLAGFTPADALALQPLSAALRMDVACLFGLSLPTNPVRLASYRSRLSSDGVAVDPSDRSTNAPLTGVCSSAAAPAVQLVGATEADAFGLSPGVYVDVTLNLTSVAPSALRASRAAVATTLGAMWDAGILDVRVRCCRGLSPLRPPTAGCSPPLPWRRWWTWGRPPAPWAAATPWCPRTRPPCLGLPRRRRPLAAESRLCWCWSPWGPPCASTTSPRAQSSSSARTVREGALRRVRIRWFTIR